MTTNEVFQMARIGLCEDDPAIRRVVIKSMELAGHELVVAHNGGEAVRLFGADTRLDAIVLDIGLPDADGRDVCQALQSNGQLAPVMFLTALGAVHDKLSGFSAGAEDYLPKPFDPLELVARVEVLARRGPAVASRDRSELALNPARHSLTFDGCEVMLTPTEFRMLAAITSRPGEVVRRRAIASAAWPSGGYVSENSIDSYIRRIRKKLKDIAAPHELVTVRGVGYTLR
jgi:two-component system OmpR family response regulator